MKTPGSLPIGVEPSAELAALFRPAIVAASEFCGSGAPQPPLAEELQCVPHARLERLQQFAAGRACARHALAALGIEGVPLRMTADRLPLWPAGFVGSITHTEGYCGAVVGSAGNLRSVGVDTEVIERVGAHLWPRICTPRELSQIGRMPAEYARRAAALLFAAKEAWYKCQYPLSHQWFDFPQVTVEWDGLEIGLGDFTAQPERMPEGDWQYPVPSRGRFRFHGIYVSAGVAC